MTRREFTRKSTMLGAGLAASNFLVFAGKRAVRYADFHVKMMRYARLLADTLTERPPKLADNNLQEKMMLAKLALKVRLLGRDDMRELLRIGAINIFDVVEEELEAPAPARGRTRMGRRTTSQVHACTEMGASLNR